MKKIISILLICFMFAIVFTACGSSAKTVVLSGTGKGLADDITVDVTLKGDKITKIEATSLKDSPGVSKKAAENIIARILDKNSVEGVEVVTGATYTSKGILEAVTNALSKK